MRRAARPAQAKTCKERRGVAPLPYSIHFPVYLPASSLSPKPSGRRGVLPLRMDSSIAATPARYINAYRIKRQIYQPGLSS